MQYEWSIHVDKCEVRETISRFVLKDSGVLSDQSTSQSRMQDDPTAGTISTANSERRQLTWLRGGISGL